MNAEELKAILVGLEAKDYTLGEITVEVFTNRTMSCNVVGVTGKWDLRFPAPDEQPNYLRLVLP